MTFMSIASDPKDSYLMDRKKAGTNERRKICHVLLIANVFSISRFGKMNFFLRLWHSTVSEIWEICMILFLTARQQAEKY